MDYIYVLAFDLGVEFETTFYSSFGRNMIMGEGQITNYRKIFVTKIVLALAVSLTALPYMEHEVPVV